MYNIKCNDKEELVLFCLSRDEEYEDYGVADSEDEARLRAIYCVNTLM